MSMDFETYAKEGKAFINLICEELEIPVDKANRVVRVILHSLRNRLTHEESFDLLAQLPVSLKGVYVDGWKFNKDNNPIDHMYDFLEEVRKEDGGRSGYDFDNNLKAKFAVAVVLKTLNYIVSENEMNEILSVIPLTLKKFLKDNIAGKGITL